MLPDDQLHLLTAAVDGELTPTEVKLLRRLLASSPAAHALFGQLQADRDRLNRFAAPAPADLTSRISARLAKLPRHQLAVPSQTLVPYRRRHSWLPVAAAAMLLMAVSALSFGFFARNDARSQRSPSDLPTVQGAILPVLPPEGQSPSAPVIAESPLAVVPRIELPLPGPQPQAPLPNREFVGPPAPGPSPVFVAPPAPPVAPFNTVRIRIPYLTTMLELDREDIRQQFMEELGRESAWRIDVFADDSNRGVEQFLAAARANGLTVLADAFATERVRRKQGGAFVVYTEALNPGDLRELFGKLAANHARPSNRSSVPVFGSVHLMPLHANDHRDLRDVLGFDPGLAKKIGSAPQPRPESSTKPISSGTGDQVVRTLTSTNSKPMEKPAVLLSLSPRVNPMMSKELAEYRSRRGERMPNAVPVMIVIRTPGT